MMATPQTLMRNQDTNSPASSRYTTKRWILISILSVAAIAGGFLYSISWQGNAKQQFASRFRASFSSGLAQLCSEPDINASLPFPIPDIGPLKFPRVTEYSVTAQYIEGGQVQWGRWFYTCNARYNDGIFRFSQFNAIRRGDLPSSPGPTHVYIPWATEIIDGIPKSAGVTLTSLNVPPSIAVSEPLRVTAIAPPGSLCRLEVFPPNAVKSTPPPHRPDADGKIDWSLMLVPDSVGSRISVHVHCGQLRGTKLLENAVHRSVNVTAANP